MLPLLLLILFGIIDLGYYIYGYSTIYQAARNGTEKARMAPPYPNRINDHSERCVKAILEATEQGAVLFSGIRDSVQLSYPTGKRAISEPIQVEITYNIQPLTPLFRFVSFGNQGVMTVHVQARRSIESLGKDPNAPNGEACEQ